MLGTFQTQEEKHWCQWDIAIENFRMDYILAQVLHRSNRYGTGYLTSGRHYTTVNGEMLAQAISQSTNSPMLKTKGNIKLFPMSISVVSIKTPTIQNSNDLYKLNLYTFQLPEGIIPLDILHSIDHKTLQSLSVLILNTNNSFCSIPKNSPIAMLTPAGKLRGKLEQATCDITKLLLKIPNNTNLQLEPDTNRLLRFILDADIPQEARNRLQELLDKKYIDISQNAMDMGRTSLIELVIPTQGPLITSKPYTVLLKYC